MRDNPNRLNSKTAFSEFKLNALLQITTAINNNLPDSELFILFENILQEKLNIGKAVIFFKEEDIWKTVLRYGMDEQELAEDIITELEKVHEITVLDTTIGATKRSFDVVIPVFHHGPALAFVLLGDLDENARRLSPIIKHLGFIQTLANIIAVAVQNRQLERENQRRQRIFQELRMASKMQEMLLPKSLPNNKSLQISAIYKPHLMVGGDFYDVIEINDNETVMCVADVSGKGLSAAILMANFQANLRANVKVESDLRQVLQNLNKLVWDSADGDRYITCFLAKYFHQERKLVFVSAAHTSAIFISKNTLTYLDSSTVGIGMLEEMPKATLGEFSVPNDALMLFFTDGITETINDKGIQFQEGEFEKLALAIAKDQDFNSIPERIMNHLSQFKGNEPLSDDLALVSCRFI